MAAMDVGQPGAAAMSTRTAPTTPMPTTPSTPTSASATATPAPAEDSPEYVAVVRRWRDVLTRLWGEPAAASFAGQAERIADLVRHDALWRSRADVAAVATPVLVLCGWLVSASPEVRPASASITLLLAVAVASAVLGIGYWVPWFVRRLAAVGEPFGQHEWRRDLVSFAVWAGSIACASTLGRQLSGASSVTQARWQLADVGLTTGLQASPAAGVVLLLGAALAVTILLTLALLGIVGRLVTGYRDRHDLEWGVAAPLIDALDRLRADGVGLTSGEVKTQLVSLLGRAATNLEYAVPGSLQLAGRVEQAVLLGRARGAARSLRAWCLWVALPAEQTAEDLRGELAKVLDVVLTGRLHDLPDVAADGGTRSGADVVAMLRSLVAAVLPIAAVKLATDRGALDPTAVGAQVLQVFSVVWAILSLLLLVDAGVERKMSLLKMWTDVLSPIRSLLPGQKPEERATAKG